MNTPTNEKKILRLNASGIKDSACIRKVLFNCYFGYTTGKVANDIVYGSAFHKYVETFELTNGNHLLALGAALEHWNSMVSSMYIKDKKAYLDTSHLMNTCTKFSAEVKRNPIFTDRRVLKLHDTTLVEQKFSIKVLETDKYILLLQGTLDKLARRVGVEVTCLDDWKTTSAWNIDEYFEAYKMSLQLRLYIWALYKLCNMPSASGEFARQVWPDRNKRIPAYIYGVFLKSGGAEFRRSDEMKFSVEDMEEFDMMLENICYQFLDAVQDYELTGGIPPAWGIMNGACNAPFGGLCSFFKACSSRVGLSNMPNPNRLVLGILEGDFKRREYKPLEFGGAGKLKLKSGAENESTTS